MALGGREDAGGLAAVLAAVAVGGAGDEAAGRGGALHPLEEGREGVRGGRQVLAQDCQRAALRRFLRGDVEEDTGDEGLGFLVPVCLAGSRT